MMHLIRCLLFASLTCAALTACDELDPNDSAFRQIDDPGKIRAVVQTDTRLREPVDGYTDPENPVDVLSTFVGVELTYRNDNTVTDIRLTQTDTLNASTPSTQPVPLDALMTQQGLLYPHTFEPALTAETMTVSLDRDSPPSVDSWYPKNDSPDPDFSAYYVDTDIQIELPPDVSITAPADEEGIYYPGELNTTKNVTVTWTPFNVWNPDDISKPDDSSTSIDESTIDTAHTLDFVTRCEYSSIVNAGWVEIEGDPGMVTVSLVEFFEAQGSDELVIPTPLFFPEDECQIDVSVIRHTTGTFDADVLSESSLAYGQLRSKPVSFIICGPDAATCPRTEDDS